jgi:hypothetical protein
LNLNLRIFYNDVLELSEEDLLKSKDATILEEVSFFLKDPIKSIDSKNLKIIRHLFSKYLKVSLNLVALFCLLNLAIIWEQNLQKRKPIFFELFLIYLQEVHHRVP